MKDGLMTKKSILAAGWMKRFIYLAITFVIVQLLITVNIIDSYLQTTLITIGINIILALSLNLVTGFTGQFSLGHAGFIAIGAYTCALTVLKQPTLPMFILGAVSGAVLAAAVGFLVGLPTLRLRGDYLAIATLGMSEIIKNIILNMKITKGARGLFDIPRFVDWPVLFVFMAATLLIILNFLKSSHGRACIAIREDEIAAEAMGINTTKYKVAAFVIGAFFAGLAGALYASYFYYLDPTTFGFVKSIDVLVIVVFGGLGSISGSILSAVVLAVVSTFLQSFSEFRNILFALALIVIMIFRPQGLLGSEELSIDKLKKWCRKLLPGRKEA